jgi:TRAP-type C4-dicarboxylate transport system permease small subunit
MISIMAILLFALGAGGWVGWLSFKQGKSGSETAELSISMAVGAAIFAAGVIFADSLPRLPWILGDYHMAVYSALALLVAAVVAALLSNLFDKMRGVQTGEIIGDEDVQH